MSALNILGGLAHAWYWLYIRFAGGRGISYFKNNPLANSTEEPYLLEELFGIALGLR